MRTVDYRYWRSPIALARDQPVTHFVRHLATPDTPLLQPSDDLLPGITSRNTIEITAINQSTFTIIKVDQAVIVDIFSRINHLDDRQLVLPGELIISLIMSRHSHDRPFTIITQHIVGDPDRHLRSGSRVNSIGSREDTGLLLITLALNLRSAHCLLAISRHRVLLLVSRYLLN